MNPPVYHGAALDAAFKRAEDVARLEAEVCESALHARVKGYIDAQLQWMTDEGVRREHAETWRKMTGREPLAAQIDDLLLRAVLGGSLTLGLCTGLELRHESKSVTS